MNRVALLIGATHGGLQMVSKDIAKIRHYLKSLTGGAWNDGEIIVLEDASIEAIDAKIQSLKKSPPDFLLTYWSGHGGYSSLKEELILEVTPEKNLPESALLRLAKKQLMIFDTCSGILEEALLEAATESFKQATARSLENIEAARMYYEELIEKSSGTQIAYSCSISENSNASNERGSFFTDELIKKSKSWSSHQQIKDFLTIKEATALATDFCSRYDQYPNMQGPKIYSRSFYPFAISI